MNQRSDGIDGIKERPVDKHAQTATALLPLVGGARNVASMTHCVTRLRLALVDRSQVDDAALRTHPAALGVLEDGTYQIVVGPAVVARLAEAFARLVTEGNAESPQQVAQPPSTGAR